MNQSYVKKLTMPNFYVPSFCRGIWIFDSTTTKIIDYSQHQNHGTNSASINRGDSNYFDGASSYILLPATTSLDITSLPLAIGCTFKVDTSIGAGDYRIFYKGDAANASDFELYYNGTNNNITFRNSVIGTVATGVGTILKDTMYNILAYWDGINVYIYRNGNLIKTGALAGSPTSSSTIYIGRRPTAAYFKGKIANVSLYQHLGVNEILNHQKTICQGVC